MARDVPGVRVLSNTNDLLADAAADTAIDVVVIASPTASHFQWAKAALLAGKHVIVDKPIAATSADADELIALAEKQGRVLTVFQNRRWDGDFLTVRRCIDEGALGHVSYFEAHFDRFRPRIKAGWREEVGPGTGVLFDLGSHLIDQTLQLFGMPHAVTADIVTQRADAKVEDYFHLVLDYGVRRAVLHCTTLAAGPGYRYLVHGDAGSFRKHGMDGQEDALKAGLRPGDARWGVDAPENFGELISGDGSRKLIPTERGRYEMFYRGLAATLENGAAVPVDPRGSRDALKIIEAARKSGEERRTVLL